MKNIKLFELLSSLQPDEWKAFQRYLRFSYQRNDANTIELFLALDRFYPRFNDPTLTKEKLFKKIFLKQPYNENKINKLFSEMIKQFEDFVSTFNLSEDHLFISCKLSRFYLERSLYKHFISNQKEFIKRIESHPQGTYRNWMQYQYEELQLSYGLKINERNGHYQITYDALHELFESEKLRWVNLSLINHQPILNEHLNSNLYYIAQKQLNKLLTTGDEMYFNELLEWSKKQLIHFEDEASREILGVLKDFAIKNINSGVKEYYNILLDIIDQYIHHNIIREADGYIKTATYKNYITSCLKTRQLEKAEDFLEKFKDWVDPEYQNEVYLFNKANILFEKRKFDDVMYILNNNMFDDIFYKLNTKRLLIKTYYEQELMNGKFSDVYENALGAFKKYIYSQNDLSEIYLNANKHFIKIASQLQYVFDKKKKNELIQEISNISQLAEREWLIEKIKQH